jgi:hypothetical protein
MENGGGVTLEPAESVVAPADGEAGPDAEATGACRRLISRSHRAVRAASHHDHDLNRIRHVVDRDGDRWLG